MIEGDEDINHHIKELFILQEKYPKNITNIRLLIQVSHVLKRLSPGWFAYEGTPPKHLHSIKIDTLEDTAHQFVFAITIKLFVVVQMREESLFLSAQVRQGCTLSKRGCCFRRFPGTETRFRWKRKLEKFKKMRYFWHYDQFDGDDRVRLVLV
ncbi:unnamed protein product [Acanthoscelides obtectus]|uniref:Uncharacterized protein n=1 Tax=Acanthoscelides obtectus TaxID=200917 RepID=A0A9P0M8K5_ACAOB|nr:unnamed protein product [Acanthoscelides obtectus]CAK1679763.1 hypothetical protein AOBTE_LOCUS32429 [Acanthoscelides obtectus]